MLRDEFACAGDVFRLGVTRLRAELIAQHREVLAEDREQAQDGIVLLSREDFRVEVSFLRASEVDV